MNPTLAWALLALYLLALATGACVGIWSRHTPYTPPEVPPAPEAPSVPRDFRPRKHKAVKDRLAWRKIRPREAEALARYARLLHFHEQEEMEFREVSR